MSVIGSNLKILPYIMSTFPGYLPEIPKISIDRFDGRNLLSEAFFLSHFHSDHMVGLRSADFHAVLRKKESAVLYCSELTKLFLASNHLEGLANKIRVLPINQKITISVIGLNGCIEVTALPAGHCPGSIMFLFKYQGLNYLYTGDLRMTRENILKMKALKNSEGGLKPLETLYLDTTFFQPSYKYFPSRDHSMSELIKLCRSWIDKGKKYVIDLRTPAIVGVEYVFITLSKEFGQPFHVSDSAFQKYCRIPELQQAVTKDENTQLHACVPSRGPSPSSWFRRYHTKWKEDDVRSVKLCALSSKNLTTESSLVRYCPSDGLHRLVYSSHSSHSELVEMIETLQPKTIVPCVVPKELTPEDVVKTLMSGNISNPSKRTEDFDLLQFSSYEEVAEPDCDSDQSDDLNTEVKSKALLTLSKYNVNESSSDDDDCGHDSEDDELPPFSWNCHYDGRKALGFGRKESMPIKRPKLDN